MMARWRLEWRDPVDVTRMPDLALCRDFDTVGDLVAAAASMTAAGHATDGEFHVCLLNSDGSARARVLTDNSGIAFWAASGGDLPEPSLTTCWATDLERQTEAARAVEALRSSMGAAWRAGAIGTAEAMRLMADAGRLLDPDVDE